MEGSYPFGLFGLETTPETAKIAVIPVPWEVTTSYGSGTANGPSAILKASIQVDLFDRELGRVHEQGYALVPFPFELKELNDRLKPLASQGHSLSEINAACAKMSSWVHEQAKAAITRGQIPAVLGGDHSSPEGNIQALSEHLGGKFGILHIDAHADLRDAYQGFTRSHASIMHNVMTAKWKPSRLVQVAIRDFCEEEFALIESRADIETFFDADMKARLFSGEPWAKICADIVARLPDQVYVSLDIDGLSPEFGPSTGTPVPGGMSFDQTLFLIATVVKSGRKIVGFDLNEVAPGPTEYDANVGARLLFKLCGWTLLSQSGNHRPK